MSETSQPLLWPVSAMYGAATAVRNFYYDAIPGATRDARVPVISVGNITTGGTGKTPLVMELASRLSAWGRRPAILTRGYGGGASQEADEVLEYRECLPDVPVVVDPNRVRGAAAARARHGADCVLLDDGFQHRRLRRDLDIVVIDALNPWGGGALLPVGRLRESPAGLARAGGFVISRTNLVEDDWLQEIEQKLARFAKGRAVIRAKLVCAGLGDAGIDRRSPSELSGMRVLPVCGIGNPESFLRLLAGAGAETVERLIYRDHYRYQATDVAEIDSRAQRAGVDAVVTTRKDWVKLAPLLREHAVKRPFLRVDVRTELLDAEGRMGKLLRQALEQRGR